MPIGPKPTVVIVESPAKCKKIEFSWTRICCISIFWSFNNIEKLKDIDVSNNYKPSFNIIDSKKAHISKLKKAIYNSDKVIIATDDDKKAKPLVSYL